MVKTAIIMGMPVVIEIADAGANEEAIGKAFEYFRYVDRTFSTYKPESEMMRINRGELPSALWSADMKEILALAEETKRATDGYFDIVNRDGQIDPSGIVKGWAIRNAARLLEADGYENFYVDAGGDVEVRGLNGKNELWRIGILNPFDPKEIVKVVYASGRGVATSGTYIRGDHIYNPKDSGAPQGEIVSLTVIGPDIHEADRFATAAFAMGPRGIEFIEKLQPFEGYMIDKNGIATMTSNFASYTEPYAAFHR